MDGKRQRFDEVNARTEVLKAEHASISGQLQSKEDLYNTLMTGLSSSKNAGGGYLGQLGEAQKKLAHANAEEQQWITNLRMAEDELKAAQRKWRDVEKEAKEGSRNFETKRQEYETLQSKIASCSWNEEKEHGFESALRSAKDEVRSATQVCLLIEFLSMPFKTHNRTVKLYEAVSLSWISAILHHPRISTSLKSKVSLRH